MDASVLMGFTKMTGDERSGRCASARSQRIAGIEGIAAGPGVVAIAAVFRIGTPQARFASSSPRSACSAVTRARAPAAPGGRLRPGDRLLMLGETIDEETADCYGLVTQLTDDLRRSLRGTRPALSPTGPPWPE